MTKESASAETQSDKHPFRGKNKNIRWEEKPKKVAVESSSCIDLGCFSSVDTVESVQSETCEPQKKKKKLSHPSDHHKNQNTNRSDSTTTDALEEDSEASQPGLVMSDKVKISNAWKLLHVPQPVLIALAKLRFSTPTEIQAQVIPAAIKERRDILGAAETGSGKTLAFAIPIIHGILRDKEQEMKGEDGGYVSEFHVTGSRSKRCLAQNADVTQTGENNDGITVAEDGLHHESDEDTNSEESNGDSALSPNSPDGYRVDLDEEIQLKHLASGDEAVDESEISGCDKTDGSPGSSPTGPGARKLRALVVAPTRELAVQVKSHIDAVLTETDIKTAVVIGGMSVQKQERLLSRGPEIVIGTPGRLWELIRQGNEHLSQVDHIRYLAVDEADRMVENNHFEELRLLLEMINRNEVGSLQRQNFLFSATLSMVHKLPKRLLLKGVASLTTERKLNSMMELVGISHHHKVVDLSPKLGTARSLHEGRICCSMEEKDAYLYYFTKKHPGRTLVFCNSITSVKRLVCVLRLLKCSPEGLFGGKQQKQRLKSLERFIADPKGILIATDVAARGLDIPEVDIVIHYHVPTTAEMYVHRSGRTARVFKDGVSVLFMEPVEVKQYRSLCRTLHRTSDVPMFPIDSFLMDKVKLIVRKAQAIEKLRSSLEKIRTDKAWLQKAREEAELYCSDGNSSDEEFAASERKKESQARKLANSIESELKSMLLKPIVPSNYKSVVPALPPDKLIPTITADASELLMKKSANAIAISRNRPLIPRRQMAKLRRSEKRAAKKVRQREKLKRLHKVNSKRWK